MPPKGYKHISLRQEVYAELEKFKEEKGLTSINDAIILLLEYEEIYSRLEALIKDLVQPRKENIAEKLKRKLENIWHRRRKIYTTDRKELEKLLRKHNIDMSVDELLELLKKKVVFLSELAQKHRSTGA